MELRTTVFVKSSSVVAHTMESIEELEKLARRVAGRLHLMGVDISIHISARDRDSL